MREAGNSDLISEYKIREEISEPVRRIVNGSLSLSKEQLKTYFRNLGSDKFKDVENKEVVLCFVEY
jgi:hypothetical protein